MIFEFNSRDQEAVLHIEQGKKVGFFIGPMGWIVELTGRKKLPELEAPKDEPA